jgi:predicted PurR-regulated permease PerM
MAAYLARASLSSTPPFLAVVVVVAALYLAREVIIPLALAMLFSFLLAPATRRLEALKLGRTVSTLLSVALFIALIAAVGWAAGNQVLSLAGKLPEYQHNITQKLNAMRLPPRGALGKAAEAFKEIESEASGKPKPPPGSAPEKAQPQKPAASALPATPFELIGKLGFPLLTLLAMAAAIVVITTLMLLQRDDLRDRVIRLMGEGKIHLTTQAIEDAAGRVSRYLRMQLVVNACYGVPLAAALYFIGLPNALLFGLLGMVLRFIPYLGAALAAALPIALAFAISDGWETIFWTAGVIAILEFVTAYVIEPWLYGESTGLSPIAIVFSAIFWTWLWGPIGLLLATPLTVCISATGRYLPQLGFLNVMLGAEPVLPPQVRFYQRLVALEYEEALDMAEQFAKEQGLAALYDIVLLPALILAKRDRDRDRLDDKRERFVFESLQRIVEELTEARTTGKESGKEHAAQEQRGMPSAPPALCIVPAHDEADYIAGMMLARLLAPEHFEALLLPKDMLAAEMLDRVAQTSDKAVCISAVPPSAASNASYLCKRLRARFPQQKIVVALWNAEGNLERLQARLRDAGADEVVTRLPDAIERARLVAPPRQG